MNNFSQKLFSFLLTLAFCMPLIAQTGPIQLNPQQKKAIQDQQIRSLTSILPNGVPGPMATEAEILAWKAKQPALEIPAHHRALSNSRAVPANDDCNDAIQVYCGQTVSGNTSMASTYPGASCSSTKGVWYKFYGDGSNVTFSTCGAASYDTRISIYEGSCGSLVCLDDNDDNCPGLRSRITVKTTPGVWYYIDVNAFCCDQGGTFDLEVSCGGCDITDFDAFTYCDGTDKFDLEAFITGVSMPINGNTKYVLDGYVLPPPDFSVYAYDFGYVFWNDLTQFGTDMDMFIQADNGCTWTKNNHVTTPPGCGPNPPCDITNMTLRSANPTPCNGDGSHDLKLKLFGPSLPASDADAKAVIDGTEYPIANWNKQGNGTVNVRINNVMASGNLPNVFMQAESGCTFYIQDMYTKPNCNARIAGNLGSAFVYPNPTQGTFTISGRDFSKASFRVMNAMGQIVAKGTIENYSDQEVDLSNFDNGLYIVTVAEGENVRTERIVKR